MDDPPLRHYLRVLKRHAWLAVLVPALALGAAALVTVNQTPVYRASMGIVVGQGGSVFQPDIGEVEPLTQTLTSVLESHALGTAVIENLDLRTTPEDLLEDVRVSNNPASAVLEVSYDSSDRRQALTILNEIGVVFTSMVENSLGSREGAGAGAAVSANVFDPPHMEPDAISPRPLRNLAFAGGLGLVLGLILAFVRESLDDRIRGRRDASYWFAAPVLATLPRGLDGAISFASLAGDRLDALNLLRTKVQLLEPEAESGLIVVTSAVEEEGKASVVANLALALAAAGEDVVCVEADLHRPKLHEYLGLDQDAAGLRDILEGSAPLEDSLHEVELVNSASPLDPGRAARGRRVLRGILEKGFDGAQPRLPAAPSAPLVATRLLAIPVGRGSSDPHSITSEGIARMLASVGELARYVLVDAPPLLVVGDALPLLLRADWVIVVARQGRTTKGVAEATRATLEELGVENVGVVVTNSDEPMGHRHAHEVAPAGGRDAAGPERRLD